MAECCVTKCDQNFIDNDGARRKDRIHTSGNMETLVSYAGRANISNAQIKKLHNTQ